VTATTRLKDIVVDARHPAGLARFWATVLGYHVRPYEQDDLAFLLPGTRIEPLVGLGARVLRTPDEDIDWWVVADPEGNEFCAFPALS
jgi:Glyoxalase-like domain